MILAEVRALLVVKGDVVTGLITSYDIQGERPLRFREQGGTFACGLISRARLERQLGRSISR
jgi:hypothetical protein